MSNVAIDNGYAGGQKDPGTANNMYSQERTEGESQKEMKGITEMISSMEVVTSTHLDTKMMSYDLRSSMVNSASQQITDYLMRPQKLFTGKFQSTDNVSTFNSSAVVLPTGCLVGLVPEKIKGFMGFRATICFEIQVNGNRFQQGRYMLAYVPTGGCYKTTNVSDNWSHYMALHTYTLVERTQLPRVEFDIACDSRAQLKIPFISGDTHYPLFVSSAEQYGLIGQVQIFPYSNLNYSGGSASASWTLWSWFEDVELVSAMRPQSGFVPKKSVSEKEAASKGKGPIESTLIKVKRTADVLSKIPLLSSVTSQVSWISDIAANAASIFGLSKPNVAPEMSNMRRTAFFGLQHWDGLENIHKMSLDSKNQLAPCVGVFGTDVDEMSFDYIKTIPAWINTFTFTTDNNVDDLLWSFDMSPNSFVYSSFDDGNATRSYPPFAYMTKFFYLWRGGITFKFKIVKTEFHSGRIMFCFNPFDDRFSQAALNVGLSDYTHREIIDIRAGNEFTLTVPYVASRQWLPNSEKFGTLYAYVVDKLIAPASVPTTIDILVEACGAADFQVADYYGSTSLNPYAPSAPQSGFVPASSELNPCEIVETTIGGNPKLYSSLPASAATIGEQFTSLRQLLKISKPLQYNSYSAPGANQTLTVKAFTLPVLSYLSNAHINVPEVYPDLVAKFGVMYAMSRGSIRLKFVGSNNQGNVTTRPQASDPMWQVRLYRGSITTSMVSNSNFSTNGLDIPCIWVPPDLEQGAEIEVPHYYQLPTKNNISLIFSPTWWPGTGSNAYNNFVEVQVFGGVNNFQPRILRSVGEDFSFGVFVSTVPQFLGSYPTD